jgi:hypothetical protein
MKKAIPFLTVLLGTVVLLGSGCALSRPVGTASEVGLIDTLANDSAKGYVEFFTRSANGPVPIYLVDEQKNSHLLAAVGLNAGDKYYRREGMKVSERLRVAAPAGTHTFALQKDGPLIEVPVKASQVTCVELDYQPIDRAEHFDVYRLNYAVADPVNAPDAVGSAPRSE